jgi:hypothetical protein
MTVRRTEGVFGRLRIPVVPALVTLGVFGWAAFAALAALSYANVPPSAAFDLELLLDAGRLVAGGRSPYDPGLVAGRSVEIQSLFYSYPPIVAQVTSLVAAVPSSPVFAMWILASIALLAPVARTIRDQFAPAVPWLLPVVASVALAPLWFPFTVGALFGNLDVFFPALYGLVLVAAAAGDESGTSSRRLVIAGGVALALASITKLHPALLALWFVLRGLRVLRARAATRQSGIPLPWIVLGAAALTGFIVLAVSLVAGGVQPWVDYVAVLRAGTNVDLLDHRNLGPAVQAVMALDLGPAAVGPIHAIVLAAAIAVTAWAALRVDDPLESFAWASLASFVPMPVTWFHHFGALLPIGLAAALRSTTAGLRAQRLTLGLIGTGFLVGIFGLGMPVAWLLLPLTIAAVRASRPLSPRENGGK